jgi:hypothetical protein
LAAEIVAYIAIWGILVVGGFFLVAYKVSLCTLTFITLTYNC